MTTKPKTDAKAYRAAPGEEVDIDNALLNDMCRKACSERIDIALKAADLLSGFSAHNTATLYGALLPHMLAREMASLIMAVAKATGETPACIRELMMAAFNRYLDEGLDQLSRIRAQNESGEAEAAE